MGSLQKFYIACLGALTPIITNLLVVDLNTSLHNLSAIEGITYAIRLFALCASACIVVFLNSDEQRPVKLFQLGVMAPALLTSLINGATISIKANAQAPMNPGIQTPLPKQANFPSLIGTAFAQPAPAPGASNDTGEGLPVAGGTQHHATGTQGPDRPRPRQQVVRRGRILWRASRSNPGCCRNSRALRHQIFSVDLQASRRPRRAIPCDDRRESDLPGRHTAQGRCNRLGILRQHLALESRRHGEGNSALTSWTAGTVCQFRMHVMSRACHGAKIDCQRLAGSFRIIPAISAQYQGVPAATAAAGVATPRFSLLRPVTAS